MRIRKGHDGKWYLVKLSQTGWGIWIVKEGECQGDFDWLWGWQFGLSPSGFCISESDKFTFHIDIQLGVFSVLLDLGIDF